jgi:hypothetical protein
MRKLRENISRVNEILQQAASSILMYVYGSPVLLFVSPRHDAGNQRSDDWTSDWTVIERSAHSKLSGCPFPDLYESLSWLTDGC